jgi:fatty acid kinase fatty acid binding subunit
MAVAVVTDTTHYLPPALLADLGVREVSLYVGWDGGLRRESEIADLGGFYDELRTAATVPATSQPSVGDVLEVYEPLLAEGRDIVSIHLSAGLSGTMAAAQQARAASAAPERIEVLDSETGCGGLGLAVLAAARAASDGASREEVAEAARRAREGLRMWFCVDTLEYLRRGGRVGAAQSWIGGALKIKPILALEREITPIERVRTASRAFDRMTEYMQALQEAGRDGWAIQHIRAREQADRLADRGRALFGSEPLFISEVGPVIGAHVGPGLLGVGGVARDLVRA